MQQVGAAVGRDEGDHQVADEVGDRQAVGAEQQRAGDGGEPQLQLAPAGEVWVASADVSEGDLKIEISGRADPAPGTDVALVHDGYVTVTPLMSIVRGPARGAADAMLDALGSFHA